ncbi:MAG: DUF188 domain-containing protein [Spirochaetales bacterium]|nr:DUF188 domain-containing protein [Spirochaetales bacterium]
MTVWIDSDSCPAAVREISGETVAGLMASGKPINAVYVANRSIPIPSLPGLSFYQSSSEKESADDYIVKSVLPGDLVLTKDFLLAERILSINITAMNFDGRVFELNWLKKRIEERNMMAILYNSGSINRYRKKSRSDSKNREFSLSFSQEIDKILRQGE